MNYLEMFYKEKGTKEADDIFRHYWKFDITISSLVRLIGWHKTAEFLDDEGLAPYDLLQNFKRGDEVNGIWCCFDRWGNDLGDQKMYDEVDEDYFTEITECGHGHAILREEYERA